MLKNKGIDELNIDIEGFSGPLDLLDTLIREKKLDILNLDIAILANQYFEYIKKNINTLDIDKLSSYLLMSTYLLELKAKKILLATELSNQSKEDFEYERDKLVSRIIEYRKYKDASKKLDNKRLKREMLHAKVSDLSTVSEASERVYIEKMPDYINPEKLLSSLMKAYEKYHFSLFSKNRIIVQELSVDEVKKEIVEFFKQNADRKISFAEYLANVDDLKISEQYIVTAFLALLELVKYHFVDLTQNDKTNELLISVNDLNNESIALGKGDN